MKLSHFFIACMTLFAIACGTPGSEDNHSHEHSTEEHGHSHENGADHSHEHQEQEEFTIDADTSANDSTHHIHEDGTIHENH